MTKNGTLKVTPSTGNVFRDLGFSKEESEHLLVRADLLIQLQKAIASRALKQVQAAKVLRVTQPRVSDLICSLISYDPSRTPDASGPRTSLAGSAAAASSHTGL